MSDYSSPDELAQALSEAFESESQKAVQTGPMSDGPERTVDLDFIGDVTVTEESSPRLGEVYTVTVELDLPRHEYAGDQHGNAVYAVLEEQGVPRPDDSVEHGVAFNGPDVSVRAYVPADTVGEDGDVAAQDDSDGDSGGD